MNPVRFWLAIFTLLGIGVVAPAWMYMTGSLADGLSPVTQFLLLLVLPTTVLLTIASWLQPEGVT